MKARMMPLVWLLALTLLWACSNAPLESEPETGPADTSSADDAQLDRAVLGAACDIGDPTDSASEAMGYDPETNSAIVMNGQKVSPAGKTVEVPRYAWGVALSPDGQRAYVTNAEDGSQSVQVIDLSGDDPVLLGDSIEMPTGYGIAVTGDGQTVYVSGARSGVIHIFTWDNDTFAKTSEIKLSGYVASIVLSADEQTLYAVSPTDSLLWKVPVSDGEPTSAKVGFYPYDVALSADGQTAYATNQGSGTVSVVNTASMTQTQLIQVGDGPEGLALLADGEHLLVTNSNDETISVIATASNTVVETIELDPDNSDLVGWTPNHVVGHPSAERAYVTAADHNAVEVIDTSNWQLIGQIPTAFYPSRIVLNDDGSKIALVNAKGFGTTGRFHSTGAGVFSQFQILDTPSNSTELEEYSNVVKENTERPLGFYPDNDCERIVPLPLNENERSVIEHVILVIKENKTYDELLGDLAGPEGDEWHDPALARLWGEEVTLADETTATVTPNAHSIARTWVDMVNYYCDSEVSLQGHMWTTQADCNDFVERTRFDRVPITGLDPMTIVPSGSIFDHLDRNGVNFRVYGEIVNFAFKELDKWMDKIDLKYPFWSMGAKDVAKASEVIREWNLAVEKDEESLFPPFIYIVLPNDHTSGGKAGAIHPQTMVADNDHGLGMLVDWLSKSPFWEKSLLIAIQDDAQTSMGDHINAHRSVCYVASPWVKRGYTSTVHYSIPSVYRTIELILGLPPMNKNTLLAPPMVDIFTDQKDTTPYDVIVPTMPEWRNPEEGVFAEEAKQWNWSTFDGHKGLGDHIYRYLLGDEPRPSYVKMLDE